MLFAQCHMSSNNQSQYSKASNVASKSAFSHYGVCAHTCSHMPSQILKRVNLKDGAAWGRERESDTERERF